MPSPEEYLHRRNRDLLLEAGPPTEAYQYIFALIHKLEHEAAIPIPLADRRNAPFAMDHISFHSQLIKNRPLGVRVRELHALGTEAMDLATYERDSLVYLLHEKQSGFQNLAEGSQGPKHAVMIEANLPGLDAELNDTQVVDLRWRFKRAEDNEMALMLERIEELVELKWKFQRRSKEVEAERPLWLEPAVVEACAAVQNFATHRAETRDRGDGPRWVIE